MSDEENCPNKRVDCVSRKCNEEAIQLALKKINRRIKQSEHDEEVLLTLNWPCIWPSNTCTGSSHLQAISSAGFTSGGATTMLLGSCLPSAAAG